MNKERFKLCTDGLKTVEPPKISGGQTCGMFDPSVHYVHEDIGFEIKVNGSRSKLKNAKFAMTVFELFCDEFYP
jgi:hypothetical protein